MGALLRLRFRLIDALWLLFLAGLAVLPPLGEIHKQLLLAGLAAVQLGEGRLIAWQRRRGRVVVVSLKLLLSALLLGHTATQAGQLGINSIYYPIFFVPVITAALYFGLWATMAWTTAAAAAYCAYLIPALSQFYLPPEGAATLAVRILSFFLAALLVNQIVGQLRQTAATLELRNRELVQARAEAQRSERLAALGQLSAGLAHEIRNPLSVIKGAAEMLQRKADPADPLSGELSGYIYTEVNRLNALVARFLDFARPLRVEARRQSVTPVLERALRAVAERWPQAAVAVARTYAPDLPEVEIDEALCEQVFLNLATNAYEAMQFRGVLQVIAQPSADPAGVTVRFEDTGPGVSAAMSEEIFNPFVTTKESGVGLGLSVVSKIVDEHGGHIRLCSLPTGRGACFEVFLPLAARGAAR